MARFIPGPAGQGTHVTSSTARSFEQKTANPFQSHSWRSMLNSFGISDDNDKDSVEASAIIEALPSSLCSNRDDTQFVDDRRLRDLFPITLAYVYEGLSDPRVPRLVVYISMVAASPNGDWILELQDESGTMKGVVSALHMDILVARGQALVSAGATILIEGASVFINITPILTRYLCIHEKCVVAVW